MTCGHCASSVTAELSTIKDVTDVHVDLPTGWVTVTSCSPLDDAAVRAAVEEAGYTVAA
jgi:copper chaperone CopZ